MKTDAQWMEYALKLASYSLDESRKTACVLVGPDGRRITEGINKFPNGVMRTPERCARPDKYDFTEHAERTALYHAAAVGLECGGAVAYVTWFPCADCARALAMVGVTRLVCFEPDWTEERYGFRRAAVILKESGVNITFLPGSAGVSK